MGRKAIDITGNKYGNLLVIKKSHSVRKGMYWECKCECGEICYATQTDLNRGRRNFCKNCGTIKSHDSILNDLYVRYKKGSIKRGYQFDLSISDFKKLISSNCYYCGIEPKQKHYKNGMRYGLIYNGIDRQNNNFGYILENCVPCCKFCNFAKSRFNEKEFIEWLNFIKTNKSNTNN